MHRSFLPAVLLTASVGMLACSDDTTGPALDGDVALSVIAPVPSTGAQVQGGSVTYTDGVSTLVLTEVSIVLKEVELERADGAPCPTVEGEDDDDCEEFETGPFRLDLPLDGGVETVFQIDVPAGTYDELEFEIHKPEDNTQDDLAFLQANPELEGVSIRIEGTFDGQPFVWVADMDKDQEKDLVPPLVVAEGEGPVNVTLSLDVASWFRFADGTLIDPRTALDNQPNKGLVEDNIEASLEAFSDDDRDGEEDDD